MEEHLLLLAQLQTLQALILLKRRILRGVRLSKGASFLNREYFLEAQADDTNSAKALKDAQAADVNNTQLSRISETIARTYATLQSGNLSGEQRGKVLQEIRKPRSAKELLNVQTNAAKAELERKKLLSKPFEAVNRELESIPKKGEPAITLRRRPEIISKVLGPLQQGKEVKNAPKKTFSPAGQKRLPARREGKQAKQCNRVTRWLSTLKMYGSMRVTVTKRGRPRGGALYDMLCSNGPI